MKNKYIIPLAILLAIMVGTTVVLATDRGGNKFSDHPTETEEQKHDADDDHDDHNSDSDTHLDDAHLDDDHLDDDHDDHDDDAHLEKEHDSHSEEEEDAEHDDHDDEEGGVVALSRAQQEEIGLTVTTARSGDIEHILSLVGEVRLHEDRMAHLVPRVSGIVHDVSVSLGEEVRSGQILALIDSPELAELKADYLVKSRNLNLNRRTFERKQYLKEENIASEADWQEAQAAFQNAETVLHSARQRLLVLGMSGEEIRGLAEARDETFGHYELKSPISGTIINRHISRGEKIGGEVVFTVADLSVVWVDLQIPAKDLGRVRAGVNVEITSTEGRMADGKLTMIGPIVNEESRTALGRVILPNPQGFWRPGIFVKGLIQGKTSSSAVVVAATAVQNINGEDVIFVPDGKGFKPVDVTLGRSIQGKTEILTGLKRGDRYVTRGAFELKAVIVTSGAGAHAGHGH